MWAEKYRPNNLNDYITSPQVKNTIIKWLDDFKNKKPKAKNCLFLVGPPGTGKTTIAHLILKHYKYDILELNASEIRSQKLVKMKLDDILGKKNVLNMMCNKKTEVGIIMDEIDGMATGERSGLSELIKIMFPKKNVINKDKTKYLYLKKNPFICISNTIDKKLSDIKSKSIFIKITHPSKFQMIKYSKWVLKNENIEFDDDIINMVVQHSQLDYRRLIILLEYVFTSNKELTIENVSKLIENYQKKDVNMTYYQSAEKIFYSNIKHSEILQYYNENKSLIPMIIYENFSEHIIQNKKGDDKLKNIIEIYKNYSDSDKIDYNIYINQNWELYDANCYFKCIEPSFLIKNMEKKSYNSYNTFNFSSLLNKTSQEYCNIKHINLLKFKIYKSSENINIYNFIELFFYFIKQKYYSKAKQLFYYYKLDKDDIDKMIKYLPDEKQTEFNLKFRTDLKKILF